MLPKNILLLPILLIFAGLILVTYRIRNLLMQKLVKHILNQKIIITVKKFVMQLFSKGIINTDPLSLKYRQIITKILESKRGRRITFAVLALFAVFSYSLIPLGLVKNEFFPKSNEDTLYVNLNLPTGTNIKHVENTALSLAEELRSTPETKDIVINIGSQINSNYSSQNSANSALFTFALNPKENRKMTSSDIAAILRKKLENYSQGKISVIEISSGPPAGADVQIKLVGDDLNLLNTYADKTIQFLNTQAGIINSDKSSKTGTSKLVFIPDKNKLATNNITLDNLGLTLRSFASGFTLDTVRFGEVDQDVVFYNQNENATPENLGNLVILTPNGGVPLISLGQIKLQNNPTTINREGGKRTVTVSAGVLPGYSVSESNKKLIDFATNKLNLPVGYEWKTGGVNEENTKSVASIFRAMGFSLFLIMATMVIQFGSYRQAAMILSLIPLAVSGVFVIFGLTGTPLSFPALIGVLALFGVVVTNAMFIVEKINQNRQNGMDLIHAISDAGQSRLEPIMLTSLTSILGLVPITLANALWRGLGGAIISGLMFSGGIMLLYIPVMYHFFYSKEKKEK